MSPLRIVASVLAFAGLVTVAWRATHRGGEASAESGLERTWQSLPRIVTVEVHNGGGTPGAARDAALRLRRARLDVVAWGNAPVNLRDTTTGQVRVLVRRGDTTGTGRVAEVFGNVEVIEAPDPRRLVDLTVVVPRVTREP
jgi:hypothetical protein